MAAPSFADPALARQLYTTVVQPDVQATIAKTLRDRTVWAYITSVTSAVGHVALVVSPLLSFTAASPYGGQVYAFAAGCAGAVHVALRGFAGYAAAQSNRATEAYNQYAAAIGIPAEPEIAVVAADDDAGAAAALHQGAAAAESIAAGIDAAAVHAAINQ